MAETQRREKCPECAKVGKDTKGINLSYFTTDTGYQTSRCSRLGCAYNTKNKEGILKLSKKDAEVFVDALEKAQNISDKLSILGNYEDIIDRKISKETCELYDYSRGMLDNEEVDIAGIYISEETTPQAQKFRTKDKNFSFSSSYRDLRGKHILPFGGQIKWDKQQPLAVCEGELDSMSCYEAGFQAISAWQGAGAIYKMVSENLDWILSFKEVILALDNDEPGKIATTQVLTILKNKVRIVDFESYKDANEVLTATSKETLQLILNSAKEYTPVGIIYGKDLILEDYLKPLPEGYKVDREKFDNKTRGYCLGQFYLYGGGSGQGKSTVLKHDALILREQHNLKIAHYFLEETTRATSLSLLAMKHGVKAGDFIMNPLKYVAKKDLEDSWNKLIDNDGMVFRPVEDITSDAFFDNIEYLVSVKGYKVVILDHISLLIGSQKSSEGERRDIDMFCEKFYNLILKYQFIGIAAVQLSNPSMGKDWEEGREVKQSDMRGSASLRYKPDVIIGIERNMRNPTEKDKMELRIVKNRWFGDTGLTDTMIYLEKQGRLRVM